MAEKSNGKGLKISEAIIHANESERVKLTQLALGQIIRPEMTAKSARIRMNRLNTGSITAVELREVRGICKETGVDANYLFDIAPMKTPEP